jgi:hypothetical protein
MHEADIVKQCVLLRKRRTTQALGGKRNPCQMPILARSVSKGYVDRQSPKRQRRAAVRWNLSPLTMLV